jgi:mono/diheme cytochrome c family protein
MSSLPGVALLGLTLAPSAASVARAADPAPYIDWTPAPVTATAGAPPGYVLFQEACSVCHGSGPGKPGTRALTTKYQGKEPALLEKRTDLTADYIKYTVRHGVSVMPPFRKTELSDRDLDAIAAYLSRNQKR